MNKLNKPENSVIVERIVGLMKERGLQQKDLTDRLGIRKSVFSAWKNGSSVSYKKYLPEIAAFLGVSVDYLAGIAPAEAHSEPTSRGIYDERSNIAAEIDSSSIYRIPVYESVSAGFGAYASDEVMDYIPVVIKNPYDVEDTLAIKVRGDSMYPKIEDGDIIIVRKQTSVDSGSIAVLLLDNEEGLVKRVVYGADWIELHSINPEYKTKRFEGREVLRLRVVGLVIGSYKTF